MTFRNLAYGVLLCGLSSLASCSGDDRPGSVGEGGTSSFGGSGAFFFGGNNQGGNSGSSDDGGAAGNDPGDAGVNGGNGGSGGDGGDGGSPPLDVDSGTTAVYTVPVGGGTLTFNTTAGTTISFDFPTGAIGLQITLTPSTSEAIGWPEGTFASVIRMEPDGLDFGDEPVRVWLGDGSLMLLNFPSSATRSAPEPLALSADKQALDLYHFSSLAILAAEKSCGAQSGWVDAAGSQICATAGAGKTTYRSYSCSEHSFCHAIAAGCCVTPGTAYVGCHTGDTNLTLSYTPSETDGDPYPYCAVSVGDAGLDAGEIEDSSTPVIPYVQGYQPQQLIAGGGAQAITLQGSNFDPTGTIFVALDVQIATTWVTSSEVTAFVPVEYLLSPGTLSDVGYVNSALGGGYDWPNRSNTFDIPIVGAPGDGGTSPPDASIDDAGSNDDASSPDPDASLTFPVVTGFDPATVPSNQGDQAITLYGSDFNPNGTGFYGMDLQVDTTWINSGEVELLIPEAVLQLGILQSGALDDVGYVNPAQIGGFDWPNRSNMVSIPIVDVPDAGN